MKRLIAALTLLAFAPFALGLVWIQPSRFSVVGGGGPTLIAHAGAAGTANSATTGSIDTTGANLLVVSACWYPGTEADAVITDSKGNTWTALTRHGTVNVSVTANRLFYCYGGTVGSGHTFTTTATGGYHSIQVVALSGMAASPFDQQNGAQDSGIWVTRQPGSITPSQDNTVVVTALTFDDNTSGAISIDGSYTIADTSAFATGAGMGGSLAYKILTAASAQNPTWTSANNSGDSAVSIASFKY